MGTNIDIVYTWVDGNDPSHQEKMRPYLTGSDSRENKKFRTRYDQVNEIELSVKSIVKFAPFVKNIFIVTDNQKPNFVDTYLEERLPHQPMINIVDHKEIFKEYSSILPVFNCLPIESLLYRIPNLSENFVYFNDDFSLIKKMEPSDFFVDDKPVIRGKWSPFNENIFYKKIYRKAKKIVGLRTRDEVYGYKRGQQKAAKILGYDKYFRIDHTPAPMRKSTLKKYFEENSLILDQNVMHRFRNINQYVLQSLSDHLEIKSDTAILKNDFQLVYIGSYNKPLIWYKRKLKKSKTNENKKFLCLQSLDLCPENKLNYILGWIENNLKLD